MPAVVTKRLRPLRLGHYLLPPGRHGRHSHRRQIGDLYRHRWIAVAGFAIFLTVADVFLM